MTFCKLVIRNVGKHLRDYSIYFLTLMLSVSLFYAFNSISGQPAFTGMSMTRAMLYDQLSTILSALSLLLAAVLAFLIIYANQFLLKRRKKELGIYMLLGMKKGRISRIFAGETFCVGLAALAAGLGLGLVISQGLSLVAMKLFAVELNQFQPVFSPAAFRQTVLCFALIFFIVMACNVWSVSSVRLIDLLTASRKNENMKKTHPVFPLLFLLLSLALIAAAAVLIRRNGILPSRDSSFFQAAALALAAGTFLFFYALSAVFIRTVRTDSAFCLKGLNTFLVRQIGSKIRTNYFILAIVCGLLTVTICTVSIGASTVFAMNELAQAAAPYDLNVLSDVETDGDSSIAEYLSGQGVEIADYASRMEQISLYDADITYGELFEGQKLSLWPIDEPVPETQVWVISITDFNRALAMQGKEEVQLEEGQYLINCNYKGTWDYIQAALDSHPALTVGGVTLERASDTPLRETCFMTSVGNNDRGTLIVPDHVVSNLEKDLNILLVQYRPEANPDEILAKMIPIGLDEAHGYRYAEKNMMYDAFYGSNALVSFICCYIGLVFLLICAALLALKQLTETADNIYRYELLRKLGASKRQVSRAVFLQTALFFALPLAVAGLYSTVLVDESMKVVEEFMNMHISANVTVTILLFLAVYGSYFLATWLACKRIAEEQGVYGRY